ncbi:hypothetical protein DERF_010858 [Dermatophagoides farinae]|uniref:Uncharacterized protein n=1 Tax=Dermatophagoides farinae TaxID=6954 RepID=A0A922HTV1_DERFA|nr:hypothetical protein DERF_010858 [Dermatophagoides farinae]
MSHSEVTTGRSPIGGPLNTSADYRQQFIHIDTIGGFRESFSQLRYFHVAIDSFSRYVWGITSKIQNLQT